MKVKGYKTEVIDVEVIPGDVIDSVRRQWLRTMRGDWIRNGHWYREEYTSHSWDDDRGEATEEQIKIYDAFKTIEEVLKTLK